MSFGQKLRKLREEANQSLQQVATAVGSSKAHIWELESGKSGNPSIELVKKLADHFKVSVAWFVGEAEFKGKEGEGNVALIRAINDLSPGNLDILQSLVDGMRRNQK